MKVSCDNTKSIMPDLKFKATEILSIYSKHNY